MAFAHAKVHWGKMDAEKLMTKGPPEGKEHRKPELYYDSILKGAALRRSNAPRTLYFHEYGHAVLCNAKQGRMYYLLPAYVNVFHPVRVFEIY